jgi:hypothetical protein
MVIAEMLAEVNLISDQRLYNAFSPRTRKPLHPS